MGNPTVTPVGSWNPRKGKTWTYEQAAAKKDKAEQFSRDVLEDDDLADDIAAMSVEEYAEDRGAELVKQGESMIRKNVTPRTNASTQSKTATAVSRTNPAVAALQTASDALAKQNDLQAQVRDLQDELQDRDRLLDAIVDIVDDPDEDFDAQSRIEAIQDLIPDDDSGND